MSTLRQVSKRPKTTKSKASTADSRYRRRLVELIQDVDPSIEGTRMGLALKLLEPEIQERDQTFLRRFYRWYDKASLMDWNDLKRLARFSRSKEPVGINVIANNLRVSFADALFAVLKLASLGVAWRTSIKSGDIEVRFALASKIAFVIEVHEKGLIEMGEELTAQEHKAVLNGDLGKMPKEMVKEAFDLVAKQSDLRGSVSCGPDDLEDIFGDLEEESPVSPVPTPQELIEMMEVMEERIQAAEELAGRVAKLEDMVLAKAVKPEDDPDLKTRLMHAIKTLAPVFMPTSRPNNLKLREERAAELAEAVAAELFEEELFEEDNHP
jgi:hypothetical protein